MTPPRLQRSLISGFLHSLAARPNGKALELGDLLLSYEQLWNYAGKITAGLNGVLDPSEKVVAVLADRSVGAYGGILGVLGSGRGYVPLNPKFPIERTLHMLRASGCKTLIVGEECAAMLASLLPHLGQPMTLLLPDPGWTPEIPAPHRVISARELKKIAD